MAKTKSINGTMLKMTHVESTAYGNHVRLKRGTLTPVILSNGMKTSAINQTRANLMAKVIFDAVTTFAPNFKDGKFWNRLVSNFRKQKKAGKAYTYQEFNSIEVRREYPLSNHGSFNLDIENGTALLHYNFTNDEPYLLSVLRIAADDTLLFPYPQEIAEIRTTGEINSGTLRLNFTPLPNHKTTLYAVQAQQIVNGQPNKGFKERGLKFYTF